MATLIEKIFVQTEICEYCKKPMKINKVHEDFIIFDCPCTRGRTQSRSEVGIKNKIDFANLIKNILIVFAIGFLALCAVVKYFL